MSWRTVRMPLMFMLSMSLIGLEFYPALLIAFGLVIYCLKNDRQYDAVIMTIFLYGGYNFYKMPPISRMVILFAVALMALFVLRKSPLVKRTFALMGLYFVALMVAALHSIEPLSHQMPILSKYLNFLFFVVPLLYFNGKPFDFGKFWHAMFPYAMLICIFYAIDYFVFCGFILHPFPARSINTFYDLDWDPLSFDFIRQRPPSYYLLVFLVYPLARGWKMPWWAWGLVLLGVVVTQTFTVLTGFLVAFIISQGSFRKYAKYLVGGVLALVLAYTADVMITNGNYRDTGEGQESVLRVESSLKQLIGIQEINDEEDLAKLGTGRMGQTIPKIALIEELEMTGMGFGFLHPQLTTNQIFYVYNPFYSDITKADELASEVEITPVQVFLHMGWYGIVVQVLWLTGLWLIVRRQPMGKYFLVIMIFFLWLGVSGYSGMIMAHGQIIAATAFAGVILSDPRRPVYRENPSLLPPDYR